MAFLNQPTLKEKHEDDMFDLKEKQKAKLKAKTESCEKSVQEYKSKYERIQDDWKEFKDEHLSILLAKLQQAQEVVQQQLVREIITSHMCPSLSMLRAWQ